MAVTTTIGGIEVVINADATGFHSSLNRVKQSLRDSGRELRQGANKYGAWAAAGVAAASAVAAAMVKSQMATIDALAKTADRLGLTTEALAGLQRSAQLTGADVSTLNMALQRMTRRVSEAAQGTGEAKKAIAELGLDAKVLAQLSPDEQFKQIADAMGDVAEQGDKVRLAMRLFDSEGVKLVNTLAMGSEKLEEQQRVTEKLGVALSRFDASKVESANDSLFSAGQVLEGVVNRVSVELAPVIDDISGRIFEAALQTNGFSNSIEKAFSIAITGAGYIANAFRGIEIIIAGLKVTATTGKIIWAEMIRTMAAGFEQFINFGIDGINQLIASINKIPGSNIPQIERFTSSTAAMFADMSNGAREDLKGLTEEFIRLSSLPMASDQLDAWYENVKRLSEKARAEFLGATGGQGGESGSGLTEQEATALNARIEAIRVGLLTEAELKREAYEADIAAIQTKREKDLTNQQYYDELERQRHKQHTDELVQISEQAAEKEKRIEEMKRQAKMSAISSAFKNASALMNTESRKMFEIGKAAAIAGAVVTGIDAAVTNYKKGSEIGGPPLGAAFAAASIAATGAQIQQIKNTKFGSAGTGQSIQGGQVVNNTATNQGPQQPNRSISIALTGSGFSGGDIRSLIAQINDELGDGVELSATGG